MHHSGHRHHAQVVLPAGGWASAALEEPGNGRGARAAAAGAGAERAAGTAGLPAGPAAGAGTRQQDRHCTGAAEIDQQPAGGAQELPGQAGQAG